MPAKNSIKIYNENGYYHLYNRGVAKGPIFLERQDYSVFLSYLKEYLSPPIPPNIEEIRSAGYAYFRKNYQGQIELLSFCLMPNHFHLLVKQKESRTIEYFMRSLLVRYSVYFNRHHQRVGHLFQDVYKGVQVTRENYFLWLSRYIHRNPLGFLSSGQKLVNYDYSSYPVYLGRRKVDWIKTEPILSLIKDYRRFVEFGGEGEPDDLDFYSLESKEEDSL